MTHFMHQHYNADKQLNTCIVHHIPVYHNTYTGFYTLDWDIVKVLKDDFSLAHCCILSVVFHFLGDTSQMWMFQKQNCRTGWTIPTTSPSFLHVWLYVRWRSPMNNFHHSCTVDAHSKRNSTNKNSKPVFSIALLNSFISAIMCIYQLFCTGIHLGLRQGVWTLTAGYAWKTRYIKRYSHYMLMALGVSTLHCLNCKSRSSKASCYLQRDI